MKHAVDHQHRRSAGARRPQALDASLGELDGIALGLKLVANFLGEAPFVLDDEDRGLGAEAGGLRHDGASAAARRPLL